MAARAQVRECCDELHLNLGLLAIFRSWTHPLFSPGLPGVQESVSASEFDFHQPENYNISVIPAPQFPFEFRNRLVPPASFAWGKPPSSALSETGEAVRRPSPIGPLRLHPQYSKIS